MTPEELAADRMTCRWKYVTNPNGFEFGEALDAAIEFAAAARERWPAALDEIERLLSQLPEGMQHCTIRFISCPLGHGRLTADNWIDHGCHWCKIKKLEAENAALRAQIAGHAERIAAQSELLSRKAER